MDQEQEWLKEVQSGMEAKSLLSHPLLQTILRDLREETTSGWRETKMSDTQARENAYHLMLAIDQFENKLNVLVDRGEVARDELDTRQNEKESDK